MYKGLKTFKYAKLSTTDESKYQAAAAKLAGAIECGVEIETNDAKLYADDVLENTDESFISGKIKLKVDDDDISIFEPILGRTVTEDTTTVLGSTINKASASVADEPIYVGFGYITKKGAKYRVVMFPKVKFKPYEPSLKTKADKTEFITPDIEGTVFPLSTGVWKYIADCPSELAAITYLSSLFTVEGNND